MTSARLTRITREVLLTSAAVLGVLCIVLTSLGLLFGVRPLLFRSGSMSPTIRTGDLSLSRTVAAADLRPGDVVSVITADGQRVTHRVVTTSYVGGATRELTLKGDANKTPDAQVYDVTSAQRVMVTIPKAGYVVNWFSTMPGVLVLVAYVLGMLLLASGRRITLSGGGSASATAGGGLAAEEAPQVQEPDPGQVEAAPPPAPGRRSRLRVVIGFAVVGVAVAAIAGWALPTWAAWTTNVAVTNTSFTAASLGAPTVTCTKGKSIVTMNWASVPNATGYVLHYGTGGATQEVVGSGTLSKVFNNVGESGTFTLNATNGNWTSATSNAKSYVIGNGGGNTSCT